MHIPAPTEQTRDCPRNCPPDHMSGRAFGRIFGPDFGRVCRRIFGHARQALRMRLAALVAVLALAGCGTIDPAVYSDEKPQLDLRTYFDGTIDAWGVFQDRSGQVVRRFTVVIEASWDGDVGTLDEDFTYSDGTRQKRVWTIRRTADGRYVGTADDVVGEAEGIAAGNALNWSYSLALPVDDKVYNVRFDDWMFLVDDDVMLNRAEMSKFGIRLGEVFLAFKRRR